MSYIRCGSNPEGLYIWDEFNNMTGILYTKIRGNKSYFIDEPIKIPSNNFHNIIKSYNKYRKEEIFSGDLNLKLEWVNINNKILKEPETKDLIKKGNPYFAQKWVLRYKNKIVFICWETTWDYITRER